MWNSTAEPGKFEFELDEVVSEHIFPMLCKMGLREKSTSLTLFNGVREVFVSAGMRLPLLPVHIEAVLAKAEFLLPNFFLLKDTLKLWRAA